MTVPEAMETTRLHRVVGRTGDRTAVVTTRPCRAPRHTILDVGLIGGGHIPMPRDVSLAQKGTILPTHHPHRLLSSRLIAYGSSHRGLWLMVLSSSGAIKLMSIQK
jgi:hypothetical protein